LYITNALQFSLFLRKGHYGHKGRYVYFPPLMHNRKCSLCTIFRMLLYIWKVWCL